MILPTLASRQNHTNTPALFRNTPELTFTLTYSHLSLQTLMCRAFEGREG